jgi:hypothetical protein
MTYWLLTGGIHVLQTYLVVNYIQTMSAGKGESKKRKIPENRLRNPKYQKKEEKQGEDDSKEKENSDE